MPTNDVTLSVTVLTGLTRRTAQSVTSITLVFSPVTVRPELSKLTNLGCAQGARIALKILGYCLSY